MPAQSLQLFAIRRGEIGRQYDGGTRSSLAERLDEGQYPFPPGTDDGEVRGKGRLSMSG